MKLLAHRYGKARVRILKVTRARRRHVVKELAVSVMLQGNFDASYTQGENRLVVPTDTMKNTINILAREKLGAENEKFGLVLAQHFLKTYRQIGRVEIEISEHCWERLRIAGKPHPHSFKEQSAARPFCRVTASRRATVVESGIEDLLVLKSTASGFEGYAKDEFTTLPETKDRILATKIKAIWLFQKTPANYADTNQRIVEAMLEAFAVNYSPSGQVTLFQMGEAALKVAPAIAKITLTLPNQHCLLINLEPFGIKNQNELFVPTTEPYGRIDGTVSRK